MYGKVTDGMCQKQFAKFSAKDFSPGNVPGSRRPVEVDRAQTEVLLYFAVYNGFLCKICTYVFGPNFQKNYLLIF